jgi:hypothetical protein
MEFFPPLKAAYVEHLEQLWAPLCRRKTESGLENGLANLWKRKNITKKPHACRGQETKWEIPVETNARLEGRRE